MVLRELHSSGLPCLPLRADSQDDDEADQEVEQTWRSVPRLENLRSCWPSRPATISVFPAISAEVDKSWSSALE